MSLRRIMMSVGTVAVLTFGAFRFGDEATAPVAHPGHSNAAAKSSILGLVWVRMYAERESAAVLCPSWSRITSSPTPWSRAKVAAERRRSWR